MINLYVSHAELESIRIALFEQFSSFDKSNNDFVFQKDYADCLSALANVCETIEKNRQDKY
jgi:hypothetical protein